MKRFGRGYRPDPLRFRTQKSSRLLLGVEPELPAAFSTEHLEAPILDQNECGSCGGHGTAQALYVASQYVHAPLGFVPSPDDIYKTARALDRARETATERELPPLDDVGSFPSDIMHALSRWGVRPMRAPSPRGYDTDVDPSNVNDEPALADLEATGRRIITGQFRIAESAGDFIAQLRAGIIHCGAVGIGVFVDTAFDNWDPGRGPLDVRDLNLADPMGGGHWLAATSYYTQDDGTIVIRGPNSWSRGWGDLGHYEVTEDWLRESCSDCYVFHIDP